MNKKHTIIAKGLLLAALCIAPLSDMLANQADVVEDARICLLYTSPSPRDCS